MRRLPLGKKRYNIKLLLMVIIILLVCCFLLTDKLIRPIVTNAATTKAQIVITNATNNAVSAFLDDTQIKYNDIANINRDNDNLISAIEIDTIKLNYIKSKITDAIVNEVRKTEKTTVSVPLGTLTKNDYLLGRGPCVNFNLDISTSVSTDYKSEFTKAGINNTLHQIIIEVTSKYYITLPWYQRQEEYVTSFIIAQTVIVGKVPDNYTSVYDGEGDLVGDIFDYGTMEN